MEDLKGLRPRPPYWNQVWLVVLPSGHQDPTGSWVPTAQACNELQISRSTLQRLKRCGLLKAGTCYYKRGLGAQSPCQWDVEACRAVLLRLAAADPADLETYAPLREG